jgi:hypothetical protein
VYRGTDRPKQRPSSRSFGARLLGDDRAQRRLQPGERVHRAPGGGEPLPLRVPDKAVADRAAQEHSDPRHGVGVVVGRPEDERTPGEADQPDLGRHDKRDAQYKENGGDREPDRSP